MMAIISGNVEDKGPVVLAVTVSMIATSTLFVFLRLISRVGIVKKVSADDYCIAVAWTFAFGLSFSICYGTKLGLGAHKSDIPSSWQSSLAYSEYAFTVLYVCFTETPV